MVSSNPSSDLAMAMAKMLWALVSQPKSLSKNHRALQIGALIVIMWLSLSPCPQEWLTQKENQAQPWVHLVLPTPCGSISPVDKLFCGSPG